VEKVRTPVSETEKEEEQEEVAAAGVKEET